jgi:hypothetical protein
LSTDDRVPSESVLPLLFRQDALCRTVGVRPDLVKRLVKARLLAPSGRDATRQPLFDADGRRRLERVRDLLQAGYAEKDIATVLGLVADRNDDATVTWLSIDDILTPPGHGATALARAAAHGLALANALRDDETPLFEARHAHRVAMVCDLIAIDLVDDARALAARHGQPLATADLRRLLDHVDIKRQAANRLARLLAAELPPTPRRTILRVRRGRVGSPGGNT